MTPPAAVAHESPRCSPRCRRATRCSSRDGYIRVFQDVRGKYGSEGDYVMTRPLRGPLNPQRVDHSTDTYDTIDWLVKNVPESNGRVGHARQLVRRLYRGDGAGQSASGAEGGGAEEPDGRRLDGRRLVSLRRVPSAEPRLLHRADVGARRRRAIVRATASTTTRTSGAPARRATSRAQPDSTSSPGGARSPSIRPTTRSGRGRRSTGSWPQQPLTVPTMWIQGLWDQEDMWGAIHCSRRGAEGRGQRPNYLVMGPWRHSQVNHDGDVARPARVGRRHGAAVPARRAASRSSIST